MNELLERIERELVDAATRRAARRRLRRRGLLVGALVLAALAAASVASAVTGFGPVAGIFSTDEPLPPSARPEPGGRLAHLRASRGGGPGFEVLFYRSRFAAYRPAVVPTYCLALARTDAQPVPKGGFSEPPRRGEAIGASVECEYALTFAVKLNRSGFRLGEGGTGGERPKSGVAIYGLVLADARRVTVEGPGGREHAQLSRSFRLEVPRLSESVHRRVESRSQRRAVGGLPRSLRVRTFLAVVEARDTPAGKRTPVIRIVALLAGGRTRTTQLGGRVVRPLPGSPNLPEPGKESVRVTAVAPDGVRWSAAGFAQDGTVCAGASKAPRDPARGDLICGGGPGYLEALTRRALVVEQGTGLPEGARSRGSYILFGLARADVRSLTAKGPRGFREKARLTPAFATVRRTSTDLRNVRSRRTRATIGRLPRSLGVRLFMVVIPPGVRDMRLVARLAGGRVIESR